MCKFWNRSSETPREHTAEGSLDHRVAPPQSPLLVVSVCTLMTRGMKGCYVYCCDPALREHLRWSASAAVEYDSEG